MNFDVLLALGGGLRGFVAERDALARRVDAHDADHQLLAGAVRERRIAPGGALISEFGMRPVRPGSSCDEDAGRGAVIDGAFDDLAGA